MGQNESHLLGGNSSWPLHRTNDERSSKTSWRTPIKQRFHHNRMVLFQQRRQSDFHLPARRRQTERTHSHGKLLHQKDESTVEHLPERHIRKNGEEKQRTRSATQNERKGRRATSTAAGRPKMVGVHSPFDDCRQRNTSQNRQQPRHSKMHPSGGIRTLQTDHRRRDVSRAHTSTNRGGKTTEESPHELRKQRNGFYRARYRQQHRPAGLPRCREDVPIR